MPGQRRHEQDHRHDAQVLEQQHADDELAVRGVDLAPLGQALEHDRRARQRDEKADEERLWRAGAPRGCNGRRRGRGQPDLDPAANRQDLPQPAKFAEGELEPDGEEEQDDADLGEVANLLCVADPAEPRRPQRRASDDEAGDGGQVDAAEDQHDGHRRGEDDDQVAQEHVSPSGAC